MALYFGDAIGPLTPVNSASRTSQILYFWVHPCYTPVKKLHQRFTTLHHTFQIFLTNVYKTLHNQKNCIKIVMQRDAIRDAVFWHFYATILSQRQ